jgi:hypothetical protein
VTRNLFSDPDFTRRFSWSVFFERVNTKSDERKVTHGVFLYVSKAFDTLWVKDRLFKLAILNIPTCLAKSLSSYLYCRTFQTSFESATTTRCSVRSGAAQSGYVSPVLISLHTNDMPSRPPPPTSRRAIILCGRHSSRSHVMQIIASRQFPENFSRQTWSLARN